MSARTERISAALNAIKTRMAEKDRQREEIANELDNKIRELADVTNARNRLQEFIDTPDWASLDGSIEKGTIVRFGTLRYSARSTHTKALTRSPLNLIYWEVLTEIG